MELDFGGFGKEYAADLAAALLREQEPEAACLVNLGGDLVLTRPRRDQQPWLVGIEHATGGAERTLDLAKERSVPAATPAATSSRTACGTATSSTHERVGRWWGLPAR